MSKYEQETKIIGDYTEGPCVKPSIILQYTDDVSFKDRVKDIMFRIFHIEQQSLHYGILISNDEKLKLESYRLILLQLKQDVRYKNSMQQISREPMPTTIIGDL